MLGWEQTVSDILHRLHLDHIKRKILVFSLLATLIPALSMGGLFYAYAKQFLTTKVTQTLNNVTAQDVRELDIWMKERVYEVRVLASSYEVSENLDTVTGPTPDPGRKAHALHRLNDYLKSVGEKFSVYDELQVIDTKMHSVASSTRGHDMLNLPPDWRRQADADNPIMGKAYRDNTLDKMVMLLAVPIKTHSGRLLGVMAVKLNFEAVETILTRSSLGKTGQIYLIAQNGTPIAGSRSNSIALKNLEHPFTFNRAAGTGTALMEYADGQGNDVLGAVNRMTQLDWVVVAQIGKNEIYAQIIRVRMLTVAICAGLLMVIGLAAYLLGLTIVRPLDRLTVGASRVASGDLEVKLPVFSRSEVGYLTEAFNGMVAQLRQNQHELATINGILTDKNKVLEVLSTTDSLTELHNRKHFMEALTDEVARAARHRRPFAVMMLDTDYFKKYNDTFGHLAGDALLKKVGVIIKESLRNVDDAARYGGDEFIILLSEVGREQALKVAERIRSMVTMETLNRAVDGVTVSVSIGLAVFPDDGETPEAIIASADRALYYAKRSGRNRVVLAGSDIQPEDVNVSN
jgi:diguanylate cyclase (GGDEF)-like protein